MNLTRCTAPSATAQALAFTPKPVRVGTILQMARTSPVPRGCLVGGTLHKPAGGLERLSGLQQPTKVSTCAAPEALEVTKTLAKVAATGVVVPLMVGGGAAFSYIELQILFGDITDHLPAKVNVALASIIIGGGALGAGLLAIATIWR